MTVVLFYALVISTFVVDDVIIVCMPFYTDDSNPLAQISLRESDTAPRSGNRFVIDWLYLLHQS